MNEDEFKGGARYIGGKLEKGVGDVVESRDWQVDGVVDQVAGGTQHMYGRAKSVIGDLVDGAPEIAEKASREARVAADRAAEAARRGVRAAQDSAKDAPVVWAIAAAAIGYGLAWWIHGQQD